MTMHMVHPGLSTLNTGKTKTKPSAKLQKAKAEHEAWLKKQGLHLSQLSAKRSATKKRLKMNVHSDNTQPVTNGFANGGFRNSVFDTEWNRRYEDDPAMAEREAAALVHAENLKGDLMPLYNKGPIQLRSKELKMTELGKRR